MGADELTATLCQASMTSVSMKRLTTVLGVAIALARAENITTREALLLLAKCAIGGSLPGRLFHAGSANDEGPAEIGQPVALAIWARIQKETRRRRFDVNPLPPMASSWMLHSDDVAELATTGAVPALFREDWTRAMATIPIVTVPPKPLQRQQAQEAEILAKLCELGFDPLALPLPLKRGAPSPAKEAVRAALNHSVDVMNKAWHRLRKDDRIMDARR